MLAVLVAVNVAALLGCGRRSCPPPEVLIDQVVTVTGRNYCLACELQRLTGAKAQCDVYGHRHTLRVELVVNEAGRPLAALVNETLHYLDNDAGAALVDSEDFDDRRVRVKGRLFVRERTIDVDEVSAL